MKKIILFLILGILTTYSVFAQCVNPVTNMSINSDTTLCAGNWSVYNINLDTAGARVFFEEGVTLQAPPELIDTCCGTYSIFSVHAENTTINCNSGSDTKLIGVSSVNYDENSYNGTFGITTDGVARTTFRDCDISGGLHSITNVADTYSVIYNVYTHDNDWSLRGGGDYSIVNQSRMLSGLRINGRDVQVLYNEISAVNLGDEHDENKLCGDLNFSGVFNNNNVTDIFYFYCPFDSHTEISENIFNSAVGILGEDKIKDVSFINNIITFENGAGCSFYASKINVSGNIFYDDYTCGLQANNSEGQFYFYNNSVFEIVDYTEKTETTYVDYCVRQGNDFTRESYGGGGNNIYGYFGFVDDYVNIRGTCGLYMKSSNKDSMLTSETDFCVNFSANMNAVFNVGMYNADTDENFIVGTFDNSGESEILHYKNYTDVCYNFADDDLTAGNYYFYISSGFDDKGYLFPIEVLGEPEMPPITGWVPMHTSSDVSSVFIDFIVEFGIQIILFVGLIAIVVLYIWLQSAI